jgi:hypothetical protein
MNEHEAREVLRNAGYCVERLWNIYDVKMNYKCNDETAMAILNSALNNDYITEEIFDCIDVAAEVEGLTKKEN